MSGALSLLRQQLGPSRGRSQPLQPESESICATPGRAPRGPYLPEFSRDTAASSAPTVLPGWALAWCSRRTACFRAEANWMAEMTSIGQHGQKHVAPKASRLAPCPRHCPPHSPPGFTNPTTATPTLHTGGHSEVPRLQALSVAQHGFATGWGGGFSGTSPEYRDHVPGSDILGLDL